MSRMTGNLVSSAPATLIHKLSLIHSAGLVHQSVLLEEVLIGFEELIGEHSGENMADVVWRTMEVYGLQGRVRDPELYF